MRSIFISFIFLSSINCFSQGTSVTFDITQASFLSPIVNLNVYSPMKSKNHVNYFSFGLGGQLATENKYFEFIGSLYSQENFPDNVALYNYNGIIGRIGYFLGKYKESGIHHKFNRLLYLGLGSNIKYVTAKEMRVYYQYNNRDIEAQRSYRIQNEKAIIISPFYNAGVQLFKNNKMLEWYSGFQVNMKFRNKSISYEQIRDHFSGIISVNQPYNERENNIMPTIVIGCRIGISNNNFSSSYY
jgi:hypothetical protein